MKMMINSCIRLFLLAFLFLFVSFESYAESPVERLISRWIGDRAEDFICESIPADKGKDVFEIQTMADGLHLRASTQTALAYAFHFYLREFCHCQISRAGTNLNLPVVWPDVKRVYRRKANFDYRYYLNYCTFNYTMSFWTWKEWERELDWMAMHGVNMPLSIIGTEAVWQRTLRKFNFTEDEIYKFLPGPAYKAWWLMGNLEGWGGPVSQAWIDSQTELQQKIVERMNELDMYPVFQGFYGMVPDMLRHKYSEHKIHYGGIWAGEQGFQRPAFLDPTDSLFAAMAKVFYDVQEKLYGAAKFYGGDPFHEGGNLEGIDITQSATSIQKAMQQAHPGAQWLLQGWWENPKEELLAGTDSDKVLILDLFGESRPQWEKRKGYDGKPWGWCALLNFGSKIGDFGKLDTFAIEPLRALQSSYGRQLKAIGTMMEGSETNPVNFELIYDMNWQNDSVDVKAWLDQFVYSRYGCFDPKARMAWEVFYKTAYSCPTNQEGPSESVFCARGSLDVHAAFRWSTTKIYYDPAVFLEGVRELSECEHLRTMDTYQYDMVDFTRQAIANYAQQVYAKIISDYRQDDRPAMECSIQRFLDLMEVQDSLLSMRREFMLGRWLKEARNAAPVQEDIPSMLQNARTLISVWGNEGVAKELHDYSNREWSGMIRDFYKPRWEMFFEKLKTSSGHFDESELDYYGFEKSWCFQNGDYYDLPRTFDLTWIQKVLQKLHY